MAGPRFFFVHLQKTGGTALFQRLRESFGASAVYPLPEDTSGPTAVLDVGHLAEQMRVHGDDIQVVTGHFPLCLVEVLDGPFTTFTVLRDPVERTLSLLRRRQMADERFRGQELADIYADPALQAIIRNHMVKMLSLTPDEMTATPLMAPVHFDVGRLERAKHNLAERIDLFGLQTELEAFCGELEARFGWDLGPPRFANRTPPQPVAQELRDRIAVDNAMDADLYEFARRLHAERHGTTAGVDLGSGSGGQAR
jgi:hypothetical protein